MFTDWVVSVVLLMFLAIIIVGTIAFNNALVKVVYNSFKGANDGQDFTSSILEIIGKGLIAIRITTQVVTFLFVVILTFQTLSYTYTYLRRMIKVAFLIMISPLVTITYAIDKLGDNKSQALNNWLKMFLVEVFIQTFHAIIYAIFFTTSIQMIKNPGGAGAGFLDNMGAPRLMGMVIALGSIKFIDDAEKIIRQIFDIRGGEQLSGGSAFAKILIGRSAIGTIKGITDRQAKKSLGDNVANKSDKQASTRRPSLPQANQPSVIPGEPSPQNRQANTDQGRTGRSTEDMSRQQASQSQFANTPNANAFQRAIGRAMHLKYSVDEALDKKIKENKFNRFKGGMYRTIKGATKTNAKFTYGLMGLAFGYASEDATAAITLGKMGVDAGENRQIVKDARAARRKNRLYQGTDSITNKRYFAMMSKKQRYETNIKLASQEAVDTYDTLSEILNKEFDITTKEGKKQLAAWIDTVKARVDSGELSKDYKDAKKDLLEYLTQNQGLNTTDANVIAMDLEKQILSLNLPDESSTAGQILETPQGQEFASVVLEQKQMDDMNDYNSLVSEIKGVEYDYNDVASLINSESYIRPTNIDQGSILETPTVGSSGGYETPTQASATEHIDRETQQEQIATSTPISNKTNIEPENVMNNVPEDASILDDDIDSYIEEYNANRKKKADSKAQTHKKVQGVDKASVNKQGQISQTADKIKDVDQGLKEYAAGLTGFTGNDLDAYIDSDNVNDEFKKDYQEYSEIVDQARKDQKEVNNNIRPGRAANINPNTTTRSDLQEQVISNKEDSKTQYEVEKNEQSETIGKVEGTEQKEPIEQIEEKENVENNTNVKEDKNDKVLKSILDDLNSKKDDISSLNMDNLGTSEALGRANIIQKQKELGRAIGILKDKVVDPKDRNNDNLIYNIDKKINDSTYKAEVVNKQTKSRKTYSVDIKTGEVKELKDEI